VTEVSEEVPKHLRLAEALRGRIESGMLAPGLVIGDLDKIVELWECTSSTVAVALSLLEREGLVQRGEQGWMVPELPPSTRLEEWPDTVRSPRMVLVAAVGHLALFCAGCGLVWNNREAGRKWEQLSGQAGEHRRLHVAGALLADHAAAEVDGEGRG
jgi:DNA-binding transcriptional MocR family regulator